MIIGSVTEFGRSVGGKTGFLSSTKVQIAKAKVDIRLVDVKTGHAYFSATGAGEASTESGEIAGFGSRADYDATLNDRAIAAAISDVIDRLVSRLADRPWRRPTSSTSRAPRSSSAAAKPGAPARGHAGGDRGRRDREEQADRLRRDPAARAGGDPQGGEPLRRHRDQRGVGLRGHLGRVRLAAPLSPKLYVAEPAHGRGHRMRKTLAISVMILLAACSMPSTVVKTPDTRPSLAFEGAPEGTVLLVDGAGRDARDPVRRPAQRPPRGAGHPPGDDPGGGRGHPAGRRRCSSKAS